MQNEHFSITPRDLTVTSGFCAIRTIAGRVFDILIMLMFGVIGYPLRKMRYPDAPLILGLILGPMLDENLRRGLILNEGSLVPFFTRPISVILIIMILMTLLSRNRYLKQTMGRAKSSITGLFRRKKVAG